MRLGRERIIFLALCVLDEAVEACNAGPLAPSVSVRLALSTLFAISDGRREAYDKFWQTIMDPMASQNSETISRYVRTSYARTEMMGIARTVGVELTVERLHQISAVTRPRDRERQVFAGLVKKAVADLQAEADAKRHGRDCRLSD